MARGIPREVLRHFQAIPLFSAVSKKGLRAIVQAGSEVDVPAGRDLVREGEVSRHLFVIRTGAAEVIRGGRKVAELGAGDFFGELSFLDGSPRSATVRAKTDMTVVILGPREMEVIVEREPAIAVRLLEAMARRVRQSERSLRH
jgi:CRP-like cAMP-binding protein